VEVYENIIRNFSEKNILIIGDIYLEQHISGRMIAFSKEGPFPVIESGERTYYPGAAGHVAALLQNFGFKAHILGLIGHDSNGNILFEELLKQRINIDGVFIHEKMVTNTHLRIGVTTTSQQSQEILRVDTPCLESISTDWQQKFLEIIEEKMEQIDAIIVIDKQACLINENIIQEILKLGRKHQKLLVGDSDKKRELFKDFDVLVCNEQEASETTGLKVTDLKSVEAIGQQILESLNNKYVVITRGLNGISLFRSNQSPVHLETQSLQVFDVTGAGDTVTATITAALVSGATIVEACRLANYAAGVAVSLHGLALVSKSELIRQVRTESAQITAEKVVTLEELKTVVDKAKQNGKSVVWTNGCFDLMHVGHILYLKEARKQGDLLVVGLNSDASVREYKGSTRPIVEESQRAKLMASLTFVDYVVIFSDKSPIGLLEYLKPSIYAKGGDYTIDTINQPERRLVEGYGGKIAIISGIDGMSTTTLIEKILAVGSAEKTETH